MAASIASTSAPLSPKLNLQLSLMMFLQYAIWGAWLPLFYRFVTEYRGLTPTDAGILLAMAAVGAIVAPFLAGQLADRKFATEKFLAFSHLVGAALVWFLAEAESKSSLMILGFFYALVYTPTLSLTNSLAFHHLPDRDRDFGRVRVWGTIGWIVVGIGIGQWLAHQHNPGHSARQKELLSQTLVDPAKRAEAINKVLITLKDGQSFVGKTLESNENVSVYLVENGSKSYEKVVLNGDVATAGLYLKSIVRPERWSEFEEAYQAAGMGEVRARDLEKFTGYSSLVEVKIFRDEGQVNDVVRVRPKQGPVVKGQLLLRSPQYVVVRTDDKQEVRFWKASDIQGIDALGGSYIGAVDKSGAKWKVKPVDPEAKTQEVDPSRVVGTEEYGLFTATAESKITAFANVSGMADALKLSAALGLILGLYSLTLPHTPPQTGKAPLAFVEAWQEIQKPRLAWLFLIAFPMACVHQFYFVHTAGLLGALQSEEGEKIAASINTIFGVGGGGLMTIGQIAEIVVLASMPFLAKRLSRKSLLSIGIVAYILRFMIFAYVPRMEAIIPALALHGVCFGCFFFVAFMIVDENTTSDVRASAQSLFNLVVVGLGIIFGNLFAGSIAEAAKLPGKPINYTQLFSVPMWVAIGCLVALLLFYPNKKAATSPE